MRKSLSRWTTSGTAEIIYSSCPETKTVLSWVTTWKLMEHLLLRMPQAKIQKVSIYSSLATCSKLYCRKDRDIWPKKQKFNVNQMQQSSDEANLTMTVTKNNDSQYNLFRNLNRQAWYSYFSPFIVFINAICKLAPLRKGTKNWLATSLVFMPCILEFPAFYETENLRSVNCFYWNNSSSWEPISINQLSKLCNFKLVPRSGSRGAVWTFSPPEMICRFLM